MTDPLRSPCGEDCIHPSHRLSEMLTLTEARNSRLENENALLDGENIRLSQETERQARVIDILHQAILDAHDEGCCCDWHLYGEDSDMLKGEYEKYVSRIGRLESALLSEQRKGESLLARIEFLKQDIRKIQAEKTACSIQHLSSEGDDIMGGYADGLSA